MAESYTVEPHGEIYAKTDEISGLASSALTPPVSPARGIENTFTTLLRPAATAPMQAADINVLKITYLYH